MNQLARSFARRRARKGRKLRYRFDYQMGYWSLLDSHKVPFYVPPVLFCEE